MLMKGGGTSVVAVITLALGIGLVTAQFSIVNGLMLKDLPFEGGARLYRFRWDNPSRNDNDLDLRVHDFHDLRAQQTTLEGLSAFYTAELAVTDPGTGESLQRYSGAFISANFLGMLGVQPQLGRGFVAGEDEPGGEAVVLLGHDVWQRDYAGDPGVIGESIFFENASRTIVGVMPEGFAFPIAQEIWAPLRMNPLEIPRAQGPRLFVYGKLKEGVPLKEAESEFAVIAGRIKAEYPKSTEEYEAFHLTRFTDVMDMQGKAMIVIMLLAVVFVLLISCANVANLLLARATLRTKELAIRNALGASRRRIVFQILTESILLSAFGAMAGIVLAMWGSNVAWHYFARMDVPYWINFDLDIRCLLFAIGATFFTGTLSGLIPALRASKTDVNEMLKDSARTSSSLRMGRFSKALVMAQLSLSCALLVVAMLFLQAMIFLNDMELPFDPERVLSTRFAMEEKDFPTAADNIAFCRALSERLEGQLGIEAVAASTRNGMFESPLTPVAIEGESYVKEEDLPTVRWEIVTGNYFETLEVPLMRGRPFALTDTPESMPVAIVNSQLAQRHWPGESPLGKRFRRGAEEGAPWLTVVGVAPDIQMEGMVAVDQDGAGFYVPMSQEPRRVVMLLMRGRGDMASWAPLVHREVHRLSPGLTMRAFETLDEDIRQLRVGMFFVLIAFDVFGVIALFLASVGVYGVVSFSVNQRTHEIGVRMALGAQKRDIFLMVMRNGMIQLAVGLVVGLGIGYGLLRVFHSVEATIPYDIYSVYATVAAILAGVSLLAMWGPARRASNVFPMVALREE